MNTTPSASTSSTPADPPTAPPPSRAVDFARGVIARLSIWATLRIAIQEGWGGGNGAQKRTLLASEIVDAYEDVGSRPDALAIEDLLLEIMADEFEVVVEDGSAQGVAEDIVRIWDESRVGKRELIDKFEGLAESMKGRRVNAREVVNEEMEVDDDDDGDEEDWEDDDEEEEERAPQLIDRRQEPEVDEDGFTLVKRR